ncbi:MAG: hypothetical protein JWO06_2916 [Bacteroidota bacterium]|nr:hypothetical protein [Bacteroidota bacterium]
MKQIQHYTPQLTRKPGFAFSSILVGLVTMLMLGISGCDTPEKALKSTDLDYKKAKAISWYNKKEYFKCIPLLEELIGLMKGRQSTEDLYYMYCKSNYEQGDYMIAAYHFKNFYDLYPNGEKAEECLYMHCKSYTRLSPKPDLDQTYTTKALDAYQFFLNSFPVSKFLKEVNEDVARLRKKLERKAMNSAELYYKTNNFKAAATCYINILKDFPDIAEGEKMSFMVIKSNIKFAQNSIPSKKAERYNNVIRNYNEFKYKFAASKYLEEAKKFEMESHYLAALSAFEWAEVGPLSERENYFNAFFVEADHQLPLITDKKEADEITKLVEKGHFLVVKNNYALSEEQKSVKKLPSLERTVKTYYNFVDKFPKSRYSKEAERIFNNSSELLKKLKTNG